MLDMCTVHVQSLHGIDRMRDIRGIRYACIPPVFTQDEHGSMLRSSGPTTFDMFFEGQLFVQ